jgi:pyruvate/2-oxoglutarate dehydrogenase complex dihydrolipoamide acyltransferase (E2) component
MLTKVKMPRLGENVNSVFIVEIKAIPGQQVEAGEALISVETDKATVDVETPVGGKIVEFLVKIDEEVHPGSPYVVLETA